MSNPVLSIPSLLIYTLYLDSPKMSPKNGERGKLGQHRLEVRWDAVMLFLNVVNLNVGLFLFDCLATCFVEVVVIMFGFMRVCFVEVLLVFMLRFNVSSFPLMFFSGGVSGAIFS